MAVAMAVKRSRGKAIAAATSEEPIDYSGK
jgi:hypothetical protein